MVPHNIKALLLVMLLSFAFLGCTGEEGDEETGSSMVTIAVTDNITDDFTSVMVTFSQVTVHRSDPGEWITVVNDTRTVDLLKLGLENDTSDLGTSELEEGNYTQIRIYVDSASGTLASDNSTVDITVSSGSLKITHPFDLTADDDRTIVIDFDLDRSLHSTGSGYRMTPVIGYVDDGDYRNQEPTCEEEGGNGNGNN